MSEHDQKQWLEIFNDALASGDSEKEAFSKAYGVVKKDLEKGMVMDMWSLDSRQLSQKAAGYNSLGMSNNKACANCNWFVPEDDACIVVQGDIVATGLSNQWTAKEEYVQEPLPVTIVKDAEETFITKMIERFKETFGLTEKQQVQVDTKQHGPFVTFKDAATGRQRFFCWPTNNFKDKHGEIIPEYAHKEFVQWCDSNKEYPELWVWHTKGAKLGEIDWLDVSDGLLVASGLIDEGEEKRLEAINDVELGMSHGMKCLVTNSGEIVLYRSYEFSILPEESAASMPGGTGFVLLSKESEMAFSETKKALLQKMGYTPEQVTEYEKNTAAMAEGLKAAGYEWKEAEVPASDLDIDDKLKEALTPFITTQNQLIEAVTAAATKISELQKSEDERVANHIAAAFAKMPQGFKASEEEKTVVTTKQAEPSVSWFNEAMSSIVAKQ